MNTFTSDDLPKWADDLAWWIANGLVAALMAGLLWAVMTLFTFRLDPFTVAVGIAFGWLIGRDGACL